MSGLLLCRSHEVQIPYFAEDLGIHLYSEEELSYYIYHNAMLITDDFIGERLFRFIGQELGMDNLEKKLRRWAGTVDLSELLLVILQDIHYYDEWELTIFKKQMDALRQLTPGKRMKRKAEYLLQGHRYAGAILQYDHLLNSSCSELKEDSFRGSLWRGRGVACARQFRFQEAAECLVKAEKSSSCEENRRMLFQILLADPTISLPPDILDRVSDEKKKKWEEQLNQARNQSRFLGKGQAAAEWMDKDNIRRAAGLQKLTEAWKTEYRRNQDS